MNVITTDCRHYFVRCGTRVETENGAARRIVGDRSHPLGKGCLCVKG